MENDTTLQRILVLDDDADYRKLLLKRLGNLYQDVEVVEYDPLDRGIPATDFDWSAFDVLFLDYDLGIGDVTGLDILQANSDNRLFPSTIMLTGAGNEDIAVRAFRFGVTDYLRKEWLDSEQISAAVDNAFAHHLNKRRILYTLEEAQLTAREESRKVMDEFKSRFGKVRELEKKRLDIEHQKLDRELQKSQQLLEGIEREWRKSEREKQELIAEMQKLKARLSTGNENTGVNKQLEKTQQDLEKTRDGIQQIEQEYEQVKARVDRVEWKQDLVSVGHEQLEGDIASFIDALEEQEEQMSDTHQLLEDKVRMSRELSRKKIADMKESDSKLMNEITSQVHKKDDG
ncbi:MAG TPA: response regulator [Gammaproteobacteria bacterium]|nr:response regulator [Gammaproteobacteria bacterium]